MSLPHDDLTRLIALTNKAIALAQELEKTLVFRDIELSAQSDEMVAYYRKEVEAKNLYLKAAKNFQRSLAEYHQK